jgi:hypothetical protein
MSQSFILPKWPPKLLVVRIGQQSSVGIFFVVFSKIIINHHFKCLISSIILYWNYYSVFSFDDNFVATIDIGLLGNPIALTA